MKAATTTKPRSTRTRRIPDAVFAKYQKACATNGEGQNWSAAELVRELRQGR